MSQAKLDRASRRLINRRAYELSRQLFRRYVDALKAQIADGAIDLSAVKDWLPNNPPLNPGDR